MVLRPSGARCRSCCSTRRRAGRSMASWCTDRAAGRSVATNRPGPGSSARRGIGSAGVVDPLGVTSAGTRFFPAVGDSTGVALFLPDGSALLTRPASAAPIACSAAFAADAPGDRLAASIVTAGSATSSRSMQISSSVGSTSRSIAASRPSTTWASRASAKRANSARSIAQGAELLTSKVQ